MENPKKIEKEKKRLVVKEGLRKRRDCNKVEKGNEDIFCSPFNRSFFFGGSISFSFFSFLGSSEINTLQIKKISR